MTSPAEPVHRWRWLAAWCVLLLPLVVLLPPIPIDETRYLTAAWEMYHSGQWLVPTVNGAWYSDKSPLLFWLVAGGWKVFGVHTWVARGESLAVAVCVLLVFRRLARRLALDVRGADTAMWLLAGCLGFVVFPVAIMFDVLLTLTVLGALHALLELDSGRWRRGTLALGVAIGAGMLAKGPVVLLDIAGAALLAPAWSKTARAHALRWYLAVAVAIAIGSVIVLCWLLPAAKFAGPEYWRPLLDKITGRLDQSFAHNRAWWWYLPLLPLLAMPWLLAVRAPRAAWRGLRGSRVARFAWCWCLPPFVVFCVISGKQIHYLLPLLPALALVVARLLQHAGARVRPLLPALLALAVGGWIVALPWLAAARFGYPPPRAVAWFALAVLVVAVGMARVWGREARGLALSATALVAITMLAAALALQPALDVRAEATFVRHALRDRVAIAYVDWHAGLFGYTGRLRQPLPWIPRDAVAAWCRAHPEGVLVTGEGHDEPPGVAPFKSWPYFLSGNGRIAAWRAADILAAGAASPRPP